MQVVARKCIFVSTTTETMNAITTPGLNKEFKVVFQPKNPELFGGKRRFAVGVYSLYKYIGVENANTAIQKAVNTTEDRYTKKFRTFGRVDFYVK